MSGEMLTCGGLERVNKCNLIVVVVHRYFAEGGDSIVSVFFGELLRAKLPDK